MVPQQFSSLGFLYNQEAKSVLLHLRDGNTKINPHKWAFFGGSSEGKETPTETFIREMKEELGIDLQPEKIVFVRDYLNEELETHRYVFYAESALKKSLMRLGEGADFAWIPLANVFQYDLTDHSKNDLLFFVKMSV